ncbi:MAG: hypothetical protein EAX95_14045 [Candidatus Thorarchaeota archaeon]|nr:hypothetical protein [Candidatus Thorarchaeota archaeon]
MAWKKESKKISELKKANTEIDMKVRSRLEEMVGEMANKDTAVSLEFLKEYLHLQRADNDAIQELQFHLGLMEGVKHGIISDDADQSIYVFFEKEVKK